MNAFKAGLLIAALTGLFVAIGYFAGGTGGMVIGLVVAAVMNLGSYWFSDKIVIKMTKAQPVDERQAPELYEMVERLSERARIPCPKIYIVPDPSPNAFATGRSPEHGVVAVNQGLLNLLDRREVEGVVAHELAHIKHRDTLTMAIVATLAGAIGVIGMMLRFGAMFAGGRDGENVMASLALAIFAPIMAMMVQMGVSRMREYEADKMAAELTQDPDGLRNALVKLHNGVIREPGSIAPQAAHMCIVNPFAGLKGISNLFSTHPPVEERVRRLESLRGQVSV
ncbi:MAG: zinc metalloprotease HtpX [Fimbriimonadaceae bacterium]